MNAAKVDKALEVIRRVLKERACPAICWSGGKDSNCLLWLCRMVQPGLPVVHIREPWQPMKQRFANTLIEDLGLEVYNWWPVGTAVMQKGKNVEIVKFFPAGNGFNLQLPTGLVAPEEGEGFVCAKDVYSCPVAQCVPPFDAFLIGHVGTDNDPLLGPLPCNVDARDLPGGPMLAFPLATWTESEIWEFTEEHNIPVQLTRYEKIDGRWQERASKRHNMDYLSACWACLDQDGPDKVQCPKYGMTLDNVSDLVRRVEPKRLKYCTPEGGEK